jgi:hypothetical protein
MRIQSLLFIGASVLVSAPAHADRDNDRGVPFERLQLQVDTLRQRIQTIEATRPAGQVCPAGQFVTGFDTAGHILCASVTGGGTPPPAPNPIPNSFQMLLQQAFNAIAGQNVPIQSQPSTNVVNGITVTVQPLQYSLTPGTVQITQTSATSAQIQIAIPNFSIDIVVNATILGISMTGNFTISASAFATIDTTIITTSSGNRRLGVVMGVDVVPGSISVSGNPPDIAVLLQQMAPFLASVFRTEIEAKLIDTANGFLPLLPEF